MVQRGIILHSFEVDSFLLDDMMEINQSLYTQEDKVSPFCVRMTQENFIRKEKGMKTKKMLGQMELLLGHVLENIKSPEG